MLCEQAASSFNVYSCIYNVVYDYFMSSSSNKYQRARAQQTYKIITVTCHIFVIKNCNELRAHLKNVRSSSCY